MICYVDSSVVLRLAFREKNRLDEWPAIKRPIASTLLHVESFRALDRVRLTSTNTSFLRESRALLEELLEPMVLVDITSDVILRASRPLRFAIKSLDAIHLATAMQWRESENAEIKFACHDTALANAARALGFEVIGRP